MRTSSLIRLPWTLHVRHLKPVCPIYFIPIFFFVLGWITLNLKGSHALEWQFMFLYFRLNLSSGDLTVVQKQRRVPIVFSTLDIWTSKWDGVSLAWNNRLLSTQAANYESTVAFSKYRIQSQPLLDPSVWTLRTPTCLMTPRRLPLGWGQKSSLRHRASLTAICTRVVFSCL